MPKEEQAVSEQSRLAAVSWTGGKDCNLALLKAWRDASLRVQALVVFRPKDAAFRAHPLPIMEVQAASLQLPLLHIEVGSEPSYKESYVAGMKGLKEDHGIEVIVTGAASWIFIKDLLFFQACFCMDKQCF